MCPRQQHAQRKLLVEAVTRWTVRAARGFRYSQDVQLFSARRSHTIPNVDGSLPNQTHVSLMNQDGALQIVTNDFGHGSEQDGAVHRR
jgi:hypothetical protein